MAPGVREGIRCDQIQLQGMSVCWHWWIDTTDGADPAPWTASSQHHWSDLRSVLQWFILTAGFTFLPALHLWFCSSLPLFPTSSSSSQWRSPLCPPLCLLFFFHCTQGGGHPPAANLKGSVCAGSSRSQTGRCFSPALALSRQHCMSGAAHMALWRHQKWIVTNQHYTTIK